MLPTRSSTSGCRLSRIIDIFAIGNLKDIEEYGRGGETWKCIKPCEGVRMKAASCGQRAMREYYCIFDRNMGVVAESAANFMAKQVRRWQDSESRFRDMG